MSLKSPTQVLFNQDGYDVAAKDGLALSENSAALLLAGSDGTNSQYITLDSSGRQLMVGAGTAGSPTGGVLSVQGTAGTGGGSVSPSDPDTIGNLKGHYRAETNNYPGYEISILDHENQNPSAGAAGGFGAPFASSDFNNQTVIPFSRLDAWGLHWGSPALNLPASSTARTVYFVGMLTSNAASVNSDLVSYGADTYGNTGWFKIVLESGEVKIRSRNQDANGNWVNRDSQAESLGANTPFIISYSYQAGTDVNANTMYVNGTAASGTAGTSGLLLTGHDTVNPNEVGGGKLIFGSYDFPGSSLIFAEFAVFNTAHDSSTRQAVEAFFANKYGITVASSGGAGDELKVIGHLDIDNFPTDLSIIQDTASELLASVGGLGASSSALVGNPVRLGLKNEADGATIDLLSDSTGRLIIDGAVPSGDPLAGAPVRIGASNGAGNAINVLADAAGRLIRVGSANAGDALAGAPVRLGGSDGSDTTDILTDSSGRLIFAGPAADGAAVIGNPVRLGASDSGNVTRDILSDGYGRLMMVGAEDAGSAPQGSPVLVAGWDGTNVRTFKTDNSGVIQASSTKSDSATLYVTAATTSSESLLASNAAREGAVLFNDSNRFLYLKLGSSASNSSFTAKISPWAHYIVPAGYTGALHGVWEAGATGNARVTEIAPGAGGGGGGGATDPSTLSGKVFWFKADAGVTTSGGAVTSWADQSASGWIPDGALFAVYGVGYNASDALLNGQPSIAFSDATGGWLRGMSGGGAYVPTGILPVGSAARTSYTVGYRDVMTGDPGGGGDGRVMWDYGNFTASRGAYGIFSSQQSGDNATALMNFSGYTGGGFTITKNVPFIISHSYVGGSEIESNDTRLNNSVPTYTVPKGQYSSGGGNQTLDTWTNSGTTLFSVGAPTQVAFAYRFSGAIAEILLFDEAHDAATQAGVNQYLANKYGISI